MKTKIIELAKSIKFKIENGIIGKEELFLFSLIVVVTIILFDFIIYA